MYHILHGQLVQSPTLAKTPFCPYLLDKSGQILLISINQEPGLRYLADILLPCFSYSPSAWPSPYLLDVLVLVVLCSYSYLLEFDVSNLRDPQTVVAMF